MRRLWIVDPIDGTREFVAGVPEWCVSVALVRDREAVAGGILNPSTGEMFLGSLDTGLQIARLHKVRSRFQQHQKECLLVSRREHQEGKWAVFGEHPIAIQPVGSIAYRLARVAAGQGAATCTFEPRSEWDIAAGVALVQASGGSVATVDGQRIQFNNPVPKVKSLLAAAERCSPVIKALLARGAAPRSGAA